MPLTAAGGNRGGSGSGSGSGSGGGSNGGVDDIGGAQSGDGSNIMEIGSAAVEEAARRVERAAAAIDSERRKKTEEDEERYCVSQRLQPAIETLARVQGMVEVAGLEEDEIIQEAYESAQRAIDGAVEAIHSGDLVSAKTAVSISLGRTEEYEHCAKREKDKVERDRSQRQECVRGLTSLGQRCVAVETLSHMLKLEEAVTLKSLVAEAQARLRDANKSVNRIGSTDYMATVSIAKRAVEAAEVGVQREKERKSESDRLKAKMIEEKRIQQEKEAEYERQRQEDAAVRDIVVFYCFFFFVSFLFSLFLRF